jgi:hypothetical protein
MLSHGNFKSSLLKVIFFYKNYKTLEGEILPGEEAYTELFQKLYFEQKLYILRIVNFFLNMQKVNKTFIKSELELAVSN